MCGFHFLHEEQYMKQIDSLYFKISLLLWPLNSYDKYIWCSNYWPVTFMRSSMRGMSWIFLSNLEMSAEMMKEKIRKKKKIDE